MNEEKAEFKPSEHKSKRTNGAERRDIETVSLNNGGKGEERRRNHRTKTRRSNWHRQRDLAVIRRKEKRETEQD